MIGVIGCGNMAGAVVRGIYNKSKQEKFLTYTPSYTRAEQLAKDVSGKAVKDLKDLAECTTLLIACKPQQLPDLVANMKGQLKTEDKYIISILAATPIARLQSLLGTKQVSRVMPNTPSLFGEGVSLLYHAPEVPAEAQTKCQQYFSACSKVHTLESEDLFDKVTTVTGSGPAYVFYFANSMVDQLKEWGVDEVVARQMVAQLFKGSASLLENNSARPWSQLIDEVTSKGGVTIEAVKVFAANGLPDLTKQALAAAMERSRQLSGGS